MVINTYSDLELNKRYTNKEICKVNGVPSKVFGKLWLKNVHYLFEENVYLDAYCTVRNKNLENDVNCELETVPGWPKLFRGCRVRSKD